MPQPIDLQTELMRVTAAERVQQTVDRVSLAAQGRITAHVQNDQVRKETLVQETHAAERSVEEKGSGKPEEKRRRKRQETAPGADQAARTFYSENEKSCVVDDPDEHRLDVTA